MMVDVVSDVVIERAIRDVAKFASDPANAPIWYANVESVEWRTTPSLEVGAEVAFITRSLGRRVAYTYRVEEVDPTSRLVMRTADGPFPMETTYTWESVGPKSTRMTLRHRGEATGFAVVAGLFMVPAMRRANRKDLDTLKALLERRSRPPI